MTGTFQHSVCRKAAFTPSATDAAMRGAAQRRTSTAHWSRRSMRRSVETLLAERSDGWGERSGGGAGRAGSWGKPVLRLAGLSAGRKSSAGAGEIQARRASTQAQSRTSRRGLKPVKFGRDFLRSKGLAQRGIESPLSCATGNNAADFPRDALAMAKEFL